MLGTAWGSEGSTPPTARHAGLEAGLMERGLCGAVLLLVASSSLSQALRGLHGFLVMLLL